MALALNLFCAATQGAAPQTFRDDEGQSVLLAAPATRIVSLSPGATAMLFAAGAGDRVVGTASFSDEPEAARAIPRIGDSQGYDLERILALRPQVIIAWGTGTNAAVLQQLRRSGIPVYSHHVARLADIPAAIERLGLLSGTLPQARAAAASIATRIAVLNAARAADAGHTVLVQIWDRPVYTIGGTQLLSDAIEHCGLRNAYGELRDASPAVTVESVLVRDPWLILAVAPSDALAAEWLDRWRTMHTLQSVRQEHLLTLSDQRFTRLGPAAIDATEALCARVHALH
jgi:iron complex transport system substrate-binding protein